MELGGNKCSQSSSCCPTNRPELWLPALEAVASLRGALNSQGWCRLQAPSSLFLISSLPAVVWDPAFQLFKNWKIFVAWRRLCYYSTEQNPASQAKLHTLGCWVSNCSRLLADRGPLALGSGLVQTAHRMHRESEKRPTEMNSDQPEFVFYLSS